MGFASDAERMNSNAYLANYNKHNAELQAILILIQKKSREGKYVLISKISDPWIKDCLESKGFAVSSKLCSYYKISWNK